MNEHSFIPFHRPEIGDAEIEEVVRTLRSGWLTTGVRTAQFEREFQKYTGAEHTLAVNSGTAAMHVSLIGLGVGPGDEVITTPLTFCATVNVILHAGATPVLADIGPDGNIDPASVADRITSRTRAVIPVHLAGAPCDMESIWSLAKKHELFVIEDAAHAAGTLYRGHHVGAKCFPSDAVAFSFYATKNLTTGEGGMVVANRDALASRIKRLTLHGISKDAWNRYAEEGSWYYEVVENGFKYNLTDIQSALGIHQLHKLEQFVERRTRYAELYDRALGDMEELELPKPVANGRHSWHLYILRLNLDMLAIDRAQFISELRNRRVGASVHFIPIFLHPFFKQWASLLHNQCPRALELYPRLISLPLYPAMTEEEVQYVATTVREIVKKFRKNRVLPINTATLDTNSVRTHSQVMNQLGEGEREMRSRTIILLVLFMFAGSSGLVAQQLQNPPAAVGTMIGPDDGVTIVALGAEDISKTWRVSSTGELTLPMVGKIQAAGKTTEQLERELTLRLKRFIREPEVTVYISEFRSETVTVEGGVAKPGRIQTEGQKTLLDVVMMAGGVNSPGPTMKVTRLSIYGDIPLPEVRRDVEGTSSSIVLPVRDVLDASSAAANLIMEPGDVVSVSTDQRLIYILGEVNHAGAVQLVTQDSVSIVQVLAAAGGMTKIAAPSRTTILRKDSEGRYSPAGSIDLKKILAGKLEDKLLLAGDIVVVPTSNTKFYIQTVLMSATTTGVASGFYILTKY